MGAPGQESLESYVRPITRIAGQMGYDPDAMTPVQWHAACDVTRTALAI